MVLSEKLVGQCCRHDTVIWVLRNSLIFLKVRGYKMYRFLNFIFILGVYGFKSHICILCPNICHTSALGERKQGRLELSSNSR